MYKNDLKSHIASMPSSKMGSLKKNISRVKFAKNVYFRRCLYRHNLNEIILYLEVDKFTSSEKKELHERERGQKLRIKKFKARSLNVFC